MSIPKDPAGAVVLSDATGSVRLGLPDTSSHTDGVVADDGTVTYADARGQAGIVVQALSGGGVRLMTVIAGRESPTEYAYPVALPSGGSLMAGGDGGFAILDAHERVVALIDAPWATDANGSAVPTRYEQRGTTIVQVVNHEVEGLVYPVVADPTVSLGWRIYVKYNKTEVKNIAAFPLTDKFKYVALVCAAIPNAIAAAGCGLYVYDSYSSVANTFKTAASRNQCVEMAYLYSGLLVSWKPYSC